MKFDKIRLTAASCLLAMIGSTAAPSTANAYCLNDDFWTSYQEDGVTVPRARTIDLYVYDAEGRSFNDLVGWSASKMQAIVHAAAENWNEVPADHPKMIFRGLLSGTKKLDVNDFPNDSVVVYLARSKEFDKPSQASMAVMRYASRWDGSGLDGVGQRRTVIKVKRNALRFDAGGKVFDLMVHEMGHVLSLGHPEDATRVDDDGDPECANGWGPVHQEDVRHTITAMNHASYHDWTDGDVEDDHWYRIERYRRFIWRDDVLGLRAMFNRSTEHSSDECDPNANSEETPCTCPAGDPDCQENEVACLEEAVGGDFYCYHSRSAPVGPAEHRESRSLANLGDFERIPSVPDGAATQFRPAVTIANEKASPHQTTLLVDSNHRVTTFELGGDAWCDEYEGNAIRPDRTGRVYSIPAVAKGGGHELAIWYDQRGDFPDELEVAMRDSLGIDWDINASIPIEAGAGTEIGVGYLKSRGQFIVSYLSPKQRLRFMMIDAGTGRWNREIDSGVNPRVGRMSAPACWVDNDEDYCAIMTNSPAREGAEAKLFTFRVDDPLFGEFQLDRDREFDMPGVSPAGDIDLAVATFDDDLDRQQLIAVFNQHGPDGGEVRRLDIELERNAAGTYIYESSAWNTIDTEDLSTDGYDPRRIPSLGMRRSTSGTAAVYSLTTAPPTQLNDFADTRCCTPGLCDAVDPEEVWPGCGPGDEGTPGCACLDVERRPTESHLEGYFADGQGSFLSGASYGQYCPGSGSGQSVCDLRSIDFQEFGFCRDCGEPGSPSASPGCPCASDADCGGGSEPLYCWGANEGAARWGYWRDTGEATGTCVPDPMEQAEAFEDLRWLCKENCAATARAQGLNAEDYVCIYNQSLDLDWVGVNGGHAKCVNLRGCDDPDDGRPLTWGECELSGRRCNPATDTCERECSPLADAGEQMVRCSSLGFPADWRCAPGFLPGTGHCVPPICADDPASSECLQFH